MAFAPVTTLKDLDALSQIEILEGYLSAERGDPEPGENRGRSFWYGWCNRQRDYHEMEITPEHHALVHAYMQRQRRLQLSTHERG